MMKQEEENYVEIASEVATQQTREDAGEDVEEEKAKIEIHDKESTEIQQITENNED